ncbi:MAG: DUF4270 domain-containing protein [Candidatus Azobacteroides sp.]|nr:DUF4270 domain-containing protein [Candidatus Azobacteroides sp.]
MNIKSLFITVISFFFLLISCDDDLNELGFVVQPPGDAIEVMTDTFQLEASTFKVDSISARSITGLLGSFQDPVFGNLKADYINQFYCPDDLNFPDGVVNSQIDSMDVILFYYHSSITGDSLAPMQASIYKINKELPRNFYSNIKPEEYCDMSQPIGQQVYTASNIGMKDSVMTSSSGSSVIYKYLRIRLPRELGQDIYEKSRTEGILDTKDSFLNYFPGVYITTNYGSGSLIEVLSTHLNIYYNYEADYNDTARDSILTLYNTREVLQLKHFENTNLEELLKPNETTAYIKTPGAVFTKLEIPIAEIIEKTNLKRRAEGYITNGVALKVKAFATPTDTEYPLGSPDYLMIIPEDEYIDFFDSSTMPDNVTTFVNTYIASYDTTNLVYNFSNLTPLIKKLSDKGIRDNGKATVYLIPVTINMDESYNVTSIGHYLKPAAVRIRKSKEDINFRVIYSKL